MEKARRVFLGGAEGGRDRGHTGEREDLYFAIGRDCDLRFGDWGKKREGGEKRKGSLPRLVHLRWKEEKWDREKGNPASVVSILKKKRNCVAVSWKDGSLPRSSCRAGSRCRRGAGSKINRKGIFQRHRREKGVGPGRSGLYDIDAAFEEERRKLKGEELSHLGR